MVRVEESDWCWWHSGTECDWNNQFSQLSSSGQSDLIQPTNGSKSVRLRNMAVQSLDSITSTTTAAIIDQSSSDCCRLGVGSISISTDSSDTNQKNTTMSSINQQCGNKNDHQHRDLRSTYVTQVTGKPTTTKKMTTSAQHHQLISLQHHRHHTIKQLKSTTRHKSSSFMRLSTLINNHKTTRQHIIGSSKYQGPHASLFVFALKLAIFVLLLLSLLSSGGNSGRFHSCYCDKHASNSKQALAFAAIATAAPRSMSDKLSASLRADDKSNRQLLAPESKSYRDVARQATTKSTVSGATLAPAMEANQIKRSGGESHPTKTASSNLPSRHKEKLLTSLSDSIERQHLMRLSPSIRSLVQPRPSKFDSGSENLTDEPRDVRIVPNSDKRSSSSSKSAPSSSTGSSLARPNADKIQYDDIVRQHLQAAASDNMSNRKMLASSTSKADQGMRQIMMMHGQDSMAATAKAGHWQQSGQSDEAASSNKSSMAKQAANALWSLAGQPLRLDQSKSKVLTSFMNYLAAPLLPASANGKQLLGLDRATVKHEQLYSLNASQLASTFTPRAIAKSYLVSPLLGLGQMFSDQDSSRRFKIKQQSTQRPHQSNSFTTDLGPNQKHKQPSYAIGDSVNKPQSFDHKGNLQLGATPGSQNDLTPASSSSTISIVSPPPPEATAPRKSSSSGDAKQGTNTNGNPGVSSWIKNGANHLAQNYLQESFRDLLTLSQLPILSGGPVSTAPSDLEPGGKQWMAKRLANQQIRGNRTRAIDDMLRYAYILGGGVRRKRDPLKALSSSPPSSNALILSNQAGKFPSFSSGLASSLFHYSSPPQSSGSSYSPLVAKLPLKLNTMLTNRKIRPRGVMWDMATDPSLAVTVFHLLERASVALPLGFLLMPFVRMIRNPLNGINLGRIIPARASHRSVDYEELAKRLEMMDKILSKALRSAHREASFYRR